MQLRSYQQDAVDSVYQYLRLESGNPCVVIPTGGGKTPVIASICRDVVKRWRGRVLVLSHIKELLVQTFGKIKMIDDDVSVGLYSAGLGLRNTDCEIIVAGIQSVYNKADDFGKIDLVLIDECHLLNDSADGMYNTFLTHLKQINNKLRIIGFTATPYRMREGKLCGDKKLLSKICYEIGVSDLIEAGYLCRLKTKGTKHKIDYAGLHIERGEYKTDEVEKLVNTDSNVRLAISELLEQTRDRNSVLIFASSIAHAKNIKTEIEKNHCECGIVTGETSAIDRETLLSRFKGEQKIVDLLGTKQRRLKYLVNVNILTTGFDATNIDCVCLLRPTASPGLYYQMVGRGFRLDDGKADCLVLDYGGNVLRHGTVDSIKIKDKILGSGEAPMKQCDKCLSFCFTGFRECPDCGNFFPERNVNNHQSKAEDGAILAGEKTTKEFEVKHFDYLVNRGKDESKPPTLRIIYDIGFDVFTNMQPVQIWVCPEHTGYARQKFVSWWRKRTTLPPPTSVDEVIENLKTLPRPKKITVTKTSGSFFFDVIEDDFGIVKQARMCWDCKYFNVECCEHFGDDDACEKFVESAVVAAAEVPF